MGQRKGRRKERSRRERSNSSSSSDSSSNNSKNHISERSGRTKIRLPRRGNSNEGFSSSSSISGSPSGAGEQQSRKRKKREVVVPVETRDAYEKRGEKKEKDKSGKPYRKDENGRDRREKKKRHKKNEKKRKKKSQRREEKTKETPPVLSQATHAAKSIHHPVSTRESINYKSGGGGKSSSSNDSDNHSSSGRASKKTRSRGRSPENPRDIRRGTTRYETEAVTVRAQDPVRVSGGVRAPEGDRDDGDASSVARRMARAKAMVPMRPEEYAAQQNTIREVRNAGRRLCWGGWVYS